MKKLSVLLLSALMVLSCLSTPAAASTTFKDVPRNHWAYNEIQFLSGKGVIKGSNGKFNPLTTLTRKDAAVMLVRAMKVKMPANPKQVPSDMKPTMGGYSEVVTAVNLGMFTLTNKKFNPNQALTRQDMARALAVGYDYTGNGKSSFKDVSKNNPYYKFIDAISENEIGSGYKDGTFKPTVSVNRAQFSVFLARIYSQPLQYTVKQNGKVLHTVRKKDKAIQLALKYERAKVHPVSNSLMTYSDKPAVMNKTGIKNGVLIYNGVDADAHFTAETFKPYLVRNTLDSSGKMFDTFIILGRKYSSIGEFAESSANKANYKEWKEYADRTFSSNGVLTSLNSAAKQSNKKVNVYIAIPYPKNSGTIFDLNGKSQANSLANRQKLVEWYMSTVQSKWNAAKYANLVFKGYYWLNETVVSQEDELLVTNVAQKIHQQKKFFIYSPHALTTNFDRWQTYGFDGAYLQPNGFRTKFSQTEVQTKLHEAFVAVQIYGSGINIEIDSYSGNQMNAGTANFKQYVEMAHRYGLPGRSLIMYQGGNMVYRMATYSQTPYQEAYSQLKNLLK